MMMTDTKVQNIATYQTPIVATYNGETVRLIATGDLEGHSPVCQFVDGSGRLGWASQKEFQVFDANFLPPSKEAISNALRSLHSAGSQILR